MSVRWRILAMVMGGAAVMTANGWAQRMPASALAGEIRESELLLQKPAEQNDGAAWWRLGMLYQDAAQYQQAERCYGRALALLRGGDPRALANAMDSMGTMYVETGAYAKAEPLEREALAMREAENDRTGVGRSWTHLAMLSLGQHDIPDAVRYAEMATRRLVRERTETGDGATPEEKMTALIDLALARCAEGDCAAGIPALKTAQRVARTQNGTNNFSMGFTDFLLGYAYWRSGGHERQAAKLMKSGAAEVQAQLGWGHPTCIATMTQYEAFLEETGNTSEAREIRAQLAQAPRSRQLTETPNGLWISQVAGAESPK
jgi:tetratricopeptide (TPR) repeat protein